jgi:hypothetical protein
VRHVERRHRVLYVDGGQHSASGVVREDAQQRVADKVVDETAVSTYDRTDI